jgi:hypothetical protein
MEVDASGAIPVQAVLKLIVDRSGTDEVVNAAGKQEAAFTKVEQSVGRIGTQMEGLARSVAGLAGITGLGAVVEKFLKIETSASNVALAMGKVTGGSSAYGGIRQELLGVQSHTGVSTGEQEAALRSLAMSVGLSPKPGQAGMLAEVIAGYSRVTGISSSSLASIVGPMLQAEGRTSSPSATAFTLGEARANLGAFPGSQIEGMLPVVSSAASAAAAGTPGGMGKGVSVGGIASLINTIGGSGVLRQPGNAQAAAEGIGGTLQGAYANPRVYAFMKMAGIGFKEQQLGFNDPKVQEKIVQEANRQYPGNTEADWKERRLLYLQLGQGELGADALEKIEHATKAGGIHPATPQMKKEASEAHHAQTLTTPEAKLKKLEGGAESWMFESPLHEALAAGGLLASGGILGALGKKGVGALRGLLSGGGAEAGAEGAAATGLGAAGVLGLGALAGIPLGLFSTNPTLSNLTGGGLAGNLTGSSRKAVEDRANAKAVSGVAAAAQKKFGASWNSAHGVQWMEHELNSPHSSFNQETRAGIGESITSPHPWAATHLLQQALGAGNAGTQAGGGEGQQFSEAVKKFSEAVDRLTKGGGLHGAAYGGGGQMHNASMGAPLVQAMQSSVPGMVMAAFLGKGNTTGGSTPSASGPGTIPVSNVTGTPSSAWNTVLGKYSGGSYGLSHVEQLAGEHPGGGAHPGDRRTVEADAKKYGVPFNVLWGIYGAESSFGKAASSFGLTGQFPGTGTSGNFSTDARMSAEDLAHLVKEMHLHVHVDVGGTKVEQHKTKIGAGKVQAS